MNRNQRRRNTNDVFLCMSKETLSSMRLYNIMKYTILISLWSSWVSASTWEPWPRPRSLTPTLCAGIMPTAVLQLELANRVRSDGAKLSSNKMDSLGVYSQHQTRDSSHAARGAKNRVGKPWVLRKGGKTIVEATSTCTEEKHASYTGRRTRNTVLGSTNRARSEEEGNAQIGGKVRTNDGKRAFRTLRQCDKLVQTQGATAFRSTQPGQYQHQLVTQRTPEEAPCSRNKRKKRRGNAAQGAYTGVAKTPRGGASGASVNLTFKQAMFAGAVSRSIAQTCMQPANVVKTLLQGRGTSKELSKLSFRLLTRGAGAQFVMSLPHGAFNFATLEVVRACSAKVFPAQWRQSAGPALDFLSSSVSTLVCSVVSTPQMVITDRIMAGMYPNLMHGVREITRSEGLGGFYTGWGANVAGKVPSYGLTWVFFQQFKRWHAGVTNRTPTNSENFMLGAAAAGASVCIMIPFDTVKTRIVTQTVQAGVLPYNGILQTMARVAREEGVGALYTSLAPRLISVVPMIGIQFGIYESIRRELIGRQDRANAGWLPPTVQKTLELGGRFGPRQQGTLRDVVDNIAESSRRR